MLTLVPNHMFFHADHDVAHGKSGVFVIHLQKGDNSSELIFVFMSKQLREQNYYQ